MFCEWANKSVDEILAERKQDLMPRANESIIDAKQRADRFEKELEKFYLSLIKKTANREAYTPTSASNYTKGILQLLRYYNMGLALRTGSPITQGGRWEGKGRHELTIEEIRKMFWKTRDLKTKLQISLATDLGFRIGSFLELTPSVFGDLNQASPIEFKFETRKERVTAHTCISKTTQELLKEYINVYEIQPEQQLFTDTEGTINRNLREIASRCGIDTKNLSFHCFRDLVIRTAQNLGIDMYLYKRMVGKTISRDMRGYSSQRVKEAFEKIQRQIAINGQILSAKHDDALIQLGQQVNRLNNLVTDLQKQSTEQAQELARLKLRYKALQKRPSKEEIEKMREMEEME